MSGYLLGFDVGSSSVKACLLSTETGTAVDSATSPKTEMDMVAEQPGWAEQHPDLWWHHMGAAVAQIGSRHAAELAETAAVGISYQMHGLVIVDHDGAVLRPSIIWCDSRAVPYGESAFRALGEAETLDTLLNSPGNFTAAKLAWVKEHEPRTFERIWKMMLPGDYLAYRLTGELCTTASGLSEGILWNAREEAPAAALMTHFGFDPEILPPHRPSFSTTGTITEAAAAELGLPAGIPVAYRAGDQPNNAFSLNVLEPGETAATAGTSGVVYGVVDAPRYDPRSRVNTFVHVNHTADRRRYGMLMCVNGTGICNRWLREHTVDAPGGATTDYGVLNRIAADAPIGSDGLAVLPYGNGAERTLENRELGALIGGLQFTRHSRAHLIRAGQEGVAFALVYGMRIMQDAGVPIERVRAGQANMFQSPIFRDAFATTGGVPVELHDTDGAEGAARGAGLGAGVYASPEETFAGLEFVGMVEPDVSRADEYTQAYSRWRETLDRHLT